MDGDSHGIDNEEEAAAQAGGQEGSRRRNLPHTGISRTSQGATLREAVKQVARQWGSTGAPIAGGPRFGARAQGRLL